MKQIDISTPKHPNTVALVDDEDYDWLSEHRWSAHEKSGTVYAERGVKVNGKWTSLPMHAEIVRAGPGEIHDHKNGIGVDNQKNNIRLCSRKDNARNQRTNSTNKSGFKGVSWKRNQQMWVAQITVDGNNSNLGCHICAMRAAVMYNQAAAREFGEFARLNDIQPNCAAATAKENEG